MELQESFLKKRKISLATGVLINLLGGVAYAWSVFVLPLHEKYGWSMSALSLAYTMSAMTSMLGNIFIVPWARKNLTMKKIILLGGLSYGLGVALSGFAPNIWLFYLTFGVMNGLGNALYYPCLISYSQQIFPEKSGFSSGMVTAGYGMGAVVWASVANWLYHKTGDISMALLILGVLFLIGICSLSRLIFEVPEGFGDFVRSRQSGTGEKKKPAAISLQEKPRGEMLKDPMFYSFYICIIAGILCGTMVVSHGSPFVQTQLGMTAEAAAAIVSVFSLANMAGRFAWGTVSDRIGRLNTTKLLYCCMVAGMAGMFLFHVTVPFVASMVLVMFCYGGLASLMAPLTSNLFGAKYITENYGIVFTVYGISSLIATPLAAKILENTGVYDTAFLVGLGFAAVGLLCNLIVAAKEKKLRKAQNA